jgi:hypothetical protein
MFRVTHAPEAWPPLSAGSLQSLLETYYDRTEWAVEELADERGTRIPKTLVDYLQHLRDENAALRDAIDALNDYVSGGRHDTHEVAQLLNGALRVPTPEPVRDTSPGMP